MKEYNLFTQKLFEQGYTFEHYPGYAKMPNPVCDRKLFDIMGGFRYENWYQNQKVYSTGCGLLCRGSDFSNGYMSYMGIDWKPEYGPELEAIDRELAELRALVDMEHERRAVKA